jgi:tetratricopeptide (TPR) repeat protein
VEHRATDAIPEAPDRDLVQTRAHEIIVQKFSRVILPWTDTQEVYLFHDDKLNINKSVELIRAGRYEQAAQMLRLAIDEHEKGEKVDNKLLAEAYCNLGISLLVSGKRSEGRDYLQKSNELNRSDLAKEALALYERIRQEDEKFKLQETAIAELGSSSQGPQEPVDEILVNSDIILLSQAKLGDSAIIAKIKRSKTKFDITTNGLLSLKKAGVSDAVIEAMTQKSH